MDFSRRMLLYLIVALVGSVCILGAYFLHRDDNETNKLIATVNRTSIWYNEIAADPGVVQLSFTQEISGAQLTSELRKQEIRNLASKIRQLILSKKIREFGLIVTEEEVRSRIDDTFRAAGITDAKANEISETSRLLYEALAEWHRHPSKEEVVYDEKLAAVGITREHWQQFRACYDTAEKLRAFIVPKNIDQMKANSYESAKRDLLCEKLRNLITKGVSVSEQEVIRVYEEKYSAIFEKPLMEQLKDQIRAELLAAKKKEAEMLWWQQEYEAARIEIHDPGFETVLDILRGQVQAPLL